MIVISHTLWAKRVGFGAEDEQMIVVQNVLAHLGRRHLSSLGVRIALAGEDLDLDRQRVELL
jgi:hypothetical protein